MKFSRIFLGMATVLVATGCTSLDTSRNLAEPNVSSAVLAQQVCSLCHGVTGQSINPTFPNLAAQQPTYFVTQMNAFRGHTRVTPAGMDYMTGISRSLTDDQIIGLSKYFAAQPVPTVNAKPANAVTVLAGKTIFENGVPDKGVPPCMSCHGPKALGMEQFPRLAHQHADYIVKQLLILQGTENRPDGAIMKAISHELTAQNMHDVAAYLQEFPSQ